SRTSSASCCQRRRRSASSASSACSASTVSGSGVAFGLTLVRLIDPGDTNVPAVTLTPMPHPIMFRDDDPGLAEVREICLGFPEAFEKVSWGRPVFCAPKMFVMYGGSAKTDVKGEYTAYPYSILVKVDESDRKALEQDT